MLFDKYINEEFSTYLNRYLTGIAKLKDNIKSIYISYELTEAFSRHACRFYINIDFIDYQTLTLDEKLLANKYFHNMWNETGDKFVSFAYKHQRSYHIDIEEIKSFIYHYQFAQEIFDGFVKEIIPINCILKIESLNQQAFFNYIMSYLKYSRWDVEEEFSFEKDYKRIMKREFDFDCMYHNILLDAAQKESFERKDTVTDSELSEANGGSITAIRKFLIDNHVLFYTRDTDEIKDIHINIVSLKEKIKGYDSRQSHDPIYPLAILKLINKKEQDLADQKAAIEEKSAQTNINLGDLVYVEQSYYGEEKQEIGVVKSLHLNYDKKLVITYNILKKDLTESRLSFKETKEDGIPFVLKSGVFNREVNERTLKTTSQMLNLIKSNGISNPLFKKKKKGANH
jgi:hypothetical protein